MIINDNYDNDSDIDIGNQSDNDSDNDNGDENETFFFKVIQYLLTHGEMDPNVKDEILQVFFIKHFQQITQS